MADRVSVWQPTPRTADVTVTKIAGYVRVRILMNRRFFRIFAIDTFYATATFNMPGTHALNTCGDHKRRMRSLAIGRRVNIASQQCWGVSAGKVRHNSSMLWVSLRPRWDAKFSRNNNTHRLNEPEIIYNSTLKSTYHSDFWMTLSHHSV